MYKFFQLVTARDKSKWYAFSIFDICLLVISGVSYFLFDSTSPALGWIFIIGMNAVETYYHNKKID